MKTNTKVKASKHLINKNNLTVRIANYLLERKFKPKHKGFFYIHSLIATIINSNNEPLVLNKKYMELAKAYFTNPMQIERDIRYAMSKSLDSKFTIKEFIVIAVFELSSN